MQNYLTAKLTNTIFCCFRKTKRHTRILDSTYDSDEVVDETGAPHFSTQSSLVFSEEPDSSMEHNFRELNEIKDGKQRKLNKTFKDCAMSDQESEDTEFFDFKSWMRAEEMG